MKDREYQYLHGSADRLALEAARGAARTKEADCYIKAYEKVLSFLISEYDKNVDKE